MADGADILPIGCRHHQAGPWDSRRAFHALEDAAFTVPSLPPCRCPVRRWSDAIHYCPACAICVLWISTCSEGGAIMSMSTHIVAFRPADEKWLQMKSVYDACVNAGISIPKEVNQFFDYSTPDPVGVEVDVTEAANKWQDDSREGFEIDIRKLPKDVYILRFYNSW
jgi:hypothetical protein